MHIIFESVTMLVTKNYQDQPMPMFLRHNVVTVRLFCAHR